jgi:hypothetical protein
MKPAVSNIPWVFDIRNNKYHAKVHKTCIYSTISISDDSLFLFELACTAARTSLNKTRLWHPQELRQRKEQIAEAWSWL